MGTDGIDDSYATTEEMYVLYRSILAIFAEHGHETGESEIQSFLPGLSRKGSGDDVSIAGMVSSNLSVAFIEVLKAQSEYSNAKAFRDQADREVTLAKEKHEYIMEALKKAKLNVDMCEQKASDAQAAIESAQRSQEEAVRRFEAAEAALNSAVQTFNCETAAQPICVLEAKQEGKTSDDSIGQDSTVALPTGEVVPEQEDPATPN